MDANRRSFMKALGVAGAAGLVAPNAAAADAAAPTTTAPTPPATVTYVFFNSVEAAWVESAVNRMVPADELGPGGG